MTDSTVKRGIKAARLFTPNLVREHPLLTFSYFRTAAGASHLDDDLESALDIIWQIEKETERHGKLPSVRTVESWIRNQDTYTQSVWKMRTNGVTDQLEFIYHDPLTPTELRTLVGWVRGMLIYYLETGKSPLMDGQSDQFNLPPPKRKEDTRV